jgi:putative flippase GtrA
VSGQGSPASEPGVRAWPSRQFLLFLLAGGTAAGVNFLSRIVYNQWLGFSAAVVLAYLSGMLTAFALFRHFVFTQSRQPWARSALIFTAVNLLAVAQTWAVSMGLLYVVLPRLGVHRFAPEISHALGIVVPVFSSYVGHKHGSFR